MRSGDLLAYLSQNCHSNGIVLYSCCYFVSIQPISHKFNSCLTDGRTDIPSCRDARTHLKKETRKTDNNTEKRQNDGKNAHEELIKRNFQIEGNKAGKKKTKRYIYYLGKKFGNTFCQRYLGF